MQTSRRGNNALTDYEIGSLIRSLLEASALEQDEAYFQMVQLVDAFKVSTATGQDLIDRMNEYGITKLLAASSAGIVIFQDNGLSKSILKLDALASYSTLIVEDSTIFPNTFNARVGEGTLQVEDVVVTNNDTSTGTLTISPVFSFSHSVGDRVSIVSGAADRTFNTGISIQVPATATSNSITFITTEPGVLVNGNFYSNGIRAKAQSTGGLTNVGVGQVTSFTSSPPFNGASVTNLTKFGGGRDTETDSEYRDRGKKQIQSLSTSIPLALQQAAIGTSDPVTGQRVTTASVVQDFDLDEVIVYIDDGTGFVPDTVSMARSNINGSISPGAPSVVLVDVSDFPTEGYIILSPEDASQVELLAYTAVNYTTKTITFASNCLNTHNSGDEVALVDFVLESAEDGQKRMRTHSSPIVRNSFRLWADPGNGVFTLQVENTDYKLNKGNGDIKIIAGLSLGSRVIANYTYYTGLVSTVQEVIYGSGTNPPEFEGESSAGVRVSVEAPFIRRITVDVSISAKINETEEAIKPLVREAIEDYINNLGIGNNIIKAEIINVAMNIAGMYNIVVNSPSGDVTILEDQLPVAFDSSGNSLVTVS